MEACYGKACIRATGGTMGQKVVAVGLAAGLAALIVYVGRAYLRA